MVTNCAPEGNNKKQADAAGVHLASVADGPVVTRAPGNANLPMGVCARAAELF
jgi:hypothetical protein